MNRAAFLKLLGLSLAGICFGQFPLQAAAIPRMVLLIELRGGNDSLNTLVPYRDPLYLKLRPQLALPTRELLTLEKGLALHPSLKPLMPLWDKGQWAWVNQVGYQAPNRSHFRSIEIWDTASRANEVLEEGWLSAYFSRIHQKGEGIVLGSLNPGPLKGGHFLSLQKPEAYARYRAQKSNHATQSEAYRHLQSVQSELAEFAQQVQSALKIEVEGFPKTGIARQFEQVAKLLVNAQYFPVFKLSQSGYDTHANQKNKQARLLRELAEGLAHFAQVMQRYGLWEHIAIMSYSEFGRRVAQNASGGTDHGAAAAHFFLGGKVQGGIYGPPPNLSQLLKGDLPPKVPMKALYATLTEKWWGQRFFNVSPLPIFRG